MKVDRYILVEVFMKTNIGLLGLFLLPSLFLVWAIDSSLRITHNSLEFLEARGTITGICGQEVPFELQFDPAGGTVTGKSPLTVT